MTTPRKQIAAIRRAMGTGPVREEKPATVKKRALGEREAEARRLREEAQCRTQ